MIETAFEPVAGSISGTPPLPAVVRLIVKSSMPSPWPLLQLPVVTKLQRK